MEDKTLQDGTLQKGLKKLHVQMVALGGVIGSAYFYGVGGFIQMTGPAAFLAFALGGILVFCTLYCLGELLVAMP
ncbi:aromatic amino acid transporter AroP, partial [Pseudomonas aeruginosa]|nr:aromatic amino acid transporter AroP [Pseudomonas aeruginosa]